MRFSVSLDGRVEELDLLPESLGLFLQRGSLLLHLADVLCGLVQGGGLADLEPTHTPRRRYPAGVSSLHCSDTRYSQLPDTATACLKMNTSVSETSYIKSIYAAWINMACQGSLM